MNRKAASVSPPPRSPAAPLRSASLTPVFWAALAGLGGRAAERQRLAVGVRAETGTDTRCPRKGKCRSSNPYPHRQRQSRRHRWWRLSVGGWSGRRRRQLSPAGVAGCTQREAPPERAPSIPLDFLPPPTASLAATVLSELPPPELPTKSKQEIISLHITCLLQEILHIPDLL